MTLKAVLLDIDGTLLASNDAHATAWLEVLGRHGIEASPDQIRSMIGMGGDKVLDRIARIAKDSPLGEQISQERQEFFRTSLLLALEPTAGARALLLHFRDSGLRLVVATSAGQDEVAGLLRQAGVDDLIELAATSDDAGSSKPDPDIVVAALEKAGLQPSEAVLLGDTPYDVAAARAAGVATVALRCGGGWSDESFETAVAIYDDPGDLLRHYETSPFSASRG